MNRALRGTVLIVVAGVLDGVQPIAGKVGVSSLHPVVLAGVAAMVTAGLLLPWVAYTGRLRALFSRDLGSQLFLIGFFSTVWTTVLLFLGASLTTGINAALLIQVEPLYGLVVGALLLNERVSWERVGWTLLLVIGAGIVAYNGSLQLQVGDLLVLVAPLGWTIGSMYAKRLPDVPAGMLVAGRYVYAALILAPLVLVMGVGEVGQLWRIEIVGAVLAVGVLYAVGLLFYYRGLKLVQLSTSIAVMNPVMALSGVVLAWPVLGEVPSGYQLVGAGVILLGILGLSWVEERHASV